MGWLGHEWISSVLERHHPTWRWIGTAPREFLRTSRRWVKVGPGLRRHCEPLPHDGRQTRECHLRTLPAAASGVLMLLAALLVAASPVTAQGGSASPAGIAPPQAELQPMPAGGEDGTAHVNGVDLHYTVYGEGDPVILLHGGLANGDYWAESDPSLSDTSPGRSSWTAAVTADPPSTRLRSPTISWPRMCSE